VTIHLESDLGYTGLRSRRRPSRQLSTSGLEYWSAPEWAKVQTLEPLDAPKPETGRDGRLVAVAPIGRAVRDAVNRGHMTWSTVALSLGWTSGPTGRADTTRVQRRLGLALTPSGRGYAYKQSRYIDRELAAKIIRAAHIDPVDVGL